MTNEELLLRYAARIAFAAAAEMEARPKPIIIPIKADEPRPPEHHLEHSDHARTLH
jgi:hypothetical protein